MTTLMFYLYDDINGSYLHKDSFPLFQNEKPKLKMTGKLNEAYHTCDFAYMKALRTSLAKAGLEFIIHVY